MLNFKQVTERYGVNRATIFRWIQDNKFPQPERNESGNLLWSEEVLNAFDKRRDAAADFLQHDEDTQKRIAEAEAKQDFGWDNDIELMHKILKDVLKLPRDCSDKTLCDAVIQYLEKTAKLERLVRELQPLVEIKKQPGDSVDSSGADKK